MASTHTQSFSDNYKSQRARVCVCVCVCVCLLPLKGLRENNEKKTSKMADFLLLFSYNGMFKWYLPKLL
jgi:hypothetical protein